MIDYNKFPWYYGNVFCGMVTVYNRLGESICDLCITEDKEFAIQLQDFHLRNTGKKILCHPDETFEGLYQ